MLDKKIVEGLKNKKVERLKSDIEYLRVKDGFKGIERGTVILSSGRTVLGFPHIKRIFTLEQGMRKNMGESVVYIEEKIDGFNVRVISHDGRVFAFSRGGFLDLFVTEKANGMGLENFFRDFPNSVLCGEMIGSTPYTSPQKGFDVKLYVFDIDRGDGTYIPCEDKYSILKKYGIAGVPVLGRFRSDDYGSLKKTMLLLNKDKKEGMVVKSADRSRLVKYVTPWSDIDDISKDSRLFFDMPIGFYYQRVFRSAFFISDFGLDHDEYAAKLGRAFYDGLINSINNAKQGNDIDQEFEIRIKDLKVWQDILHHMSREVKIEEIFRKEESGVTIIRFRKIYKRTNKLISSYAAGKGVAD